MTGLLTHFQVNGRVVALTGSEEQAKLLGDIFDVGWRKTDGEDYLFEWVQKFVLVGPDGVILDTGILNRFLNQDEDQFFATLENLIK